MTTTSTSLYRPRTRAPRFAMLCVCLPACMAVPAPIAIAAPPALTLERFSSDGEVVTETVSTTVTCRSLMRTAP